MKKIPAFLLVAILLNSVTIFAQNSRGVGVKVKDRSGKEREIKLYDASYALIIGNSNYKYWDVLNGVKSDVIAVEKALTDNGFTVETAIDLDSKNLSQRIEKFIQDYGYIENNRLLIYFAGHGFTQKSISETDDREIGFIVPIDAPLPTDKVGFLRKAVNLEKIRTFAKEIQAKHALFIFDSCFSGKLVSRGEFSVPPIIEESVAFPVRQFITAGAANQTVPDESIFRRAFIRGIEGEADLNKDGFVLVSELASYLRDRVTNYSNRRQTPLYAKIDDISLDRGDFVFEVTKERFPQITVNVTEDNKLSTSDGNGIGAASDWEKSPNKPPKTNTPKCSKKAKALQILSKPSPSYTEAARNNQISGNVELNVTFSASGTILSIAVVSGLSDGLTEKAIEAARQIKFIPETKCGVPQTVSKKVIIHFSLL